MQVEVGSIFYKIDQIGIFFRGGIVKVCEQMGQVQYIVVFFLVCQEGKVDVVVNFNLVELVQLEVRFYIINGFRAFCVIIFQLCDRFVFFNKEGIQAQIKCNIGWNKWWYVQVSYF